MAVNPHFLSEMDETPTNQIRDDLDFPHSGIFKALHLAAKGTYIIKESATDFDIAQSDGGSFTSLAIKGGAGFRHGKYVQIGSGSGTTTTILLDTSVAEGGYTTDGTSVTANQDVTPVSSDVYLMVVADSSNAIKIRGRNADTNKIPMLISASDIPIAVIKMTASSADDATDRPIQYLTTDLDDHSLSIGYASSDNYVEAMSITSNSSGDVIFEQKVSNRDFTFKMNDGGTTRDVFNLEAETGMSFNQKQVITANRATGWWTIAFLEGRSGGSASGTGGSTQRGYSKFFIKDETSSRHQLIVCEAMHLFGEKHAIHVSMTGDYSTEVINALRIQENSTYDGAVLQINVVDATNNIVVYIQDNYTDKGWQLTDAVDSTDNAANAALGLGYNNAYSTFSVVDTVTLTNGILDSGARFKNMQIDEIHNENDVAITIGSAGVVFNEDGHATNDFRVESDNQQYMFHLDSGTDMIAIAGDGTPTQTLELNGSFAGKVTTITGSTANYSIVATDYTIIGHSTAAPCTVTLPACSSHAGRILNFHQLDSGGILFAFTGADEASGFFGGSNQDTVSGVAIAQYQGLTFVSDGVSRWCAIGQSGPQA